MTATQETQHKTARPTSTETAPISVVSGGGVSPSGDDRVVIPARDLHRTAVSSMGPVLRTARLEGAGEIYRYQLIRAWGTGQPTMAVIGLNPSTADAVKDDPTTRRLMGFARAAGYQRLMLVNLYAWRTSHPSGLPRSPADPVGADNDHWIRDAVDQADLVVAAWGIHADPARVAEVLELLQHHTVWCLGRTQAGHPRHPLYLAGGTPLQIYRPARHDWGDWQPVPDPGVPEPLRERACRSCGADEVDIDPTTTAAVRFPGADRP